MVVVSFGRVLGGRRFSNTMLADSCESLKMGCYTLRPMVKLLLAWPICFIIFPVFLLFFFVLFFQFLFYFFCTSQFSAFISFTFIYISDVKIVKLASLSTLVVVSFVEHCWGDVLATQCWLTAAKVSRWGVIHRGQWKNCYGRDTKRKKDAPFLYNKIMSFLWAIKKAKKEKETSSYKYGLR